MIRIMRDVCIIARYFRVCQLYEDSIIPETLMRVRCSRMGNAELHPQQNGAMIAIAPDR